MNNRLAIENFITYCDESMIPYKTMRKLQTNTLALRHQYNQQEKDIQKRYKEADNQTDELEALIKILESRKKGMERKLNGNEIKNNTQIQKFIDLYNKWISKIENEIAD